MAAASRVPRLYHSVALLMPDGHVVTSGSNPARKTEELRIEVYWPPYLFAEARPVSRPRRRRSTTAARWPPTVADAGDIASACLIRPGATTHSTDNEQRLVDLPVVPGGGNQLTLQLPAAATVAPPGWYMLVVADTAGVPSEASWVHLT